MLFPTCGSKVTIAPPPFRLCHRLKRLAGLTPYCGLRESRLPVSDLCPAAYSERKKDGTGCDDTEYGDRYLVPRHTGSIGRVAFPAFQRSIVVVLTLSARRGRCCNPVLKAEQGGTSRSRLI